MSLDRRGLASRYCSSRRMATRRGQALRDALALATFAPLDDRDLRDSWMHFDERLDAAVKAERWGNRHAWVRSLDAQNAGMREMTLRLFEVGSLLIHYRNRDGELRAADLRACDQALEAILNALVTAWSRIPP